MQPGGMLACAGHAHRAPGRIRAEDEQPGVFEHPDKVSLFKVQTSDCMLKRTFAALPTTMKWFWDTTHALPKPASPSDTSRNWSHGTLDAGRDALFEAAKARYVAVCENYVHVPSLDREFSLATVFTLPQSHKLHEVTATWVRDQVATYISLDDVFNEQFMATVIFHSSDQDVDVKVTDEARVYLDEHGTEEVICTSVPQLKPGPYALVGKQLRDVWKLVDDFNGTCMSSLKPKQNVDGDFEPLMVLSSDNRFSTFALPSRIKTQAESDSLFAGMRVLVKDNIHLKGVKTSVGNRAFYETYSPQPASAECIQKLIAGSAVILGKTKMNYLATWEEPVQYIDYQAPWNPRADHYQSPGGSSSGSAAAIATYEWLDIAIGTDTWGSVTRPALWCGCYGLRPTFGAVSAHGIEPCCQRVFDTAGILARDLKKCRDFAAEWLLSDVLQKTPKPFNLVIFPVDFWKVIDSEQAAIGREFAQSAATHLKVDYQEISFEELWLKTSPEDAKGCTLSEFIDWAADVQDYDAYHNCDDFREKYRELTGHAPYVSPPNQKAW
ncbi:Amidase [Lachnellula suecica]|uniref:Amidase n=1 Tax=Lachnellula suecica TaxID=602035 RepID=A0A8T9CJF0_9HELO|nr:Amidase [Lachnellula suecica]